MREQVLKIYVDNENFESVKKSGCEKVNFLNFSDDAEIKQLDFIVFVDTEGNEVMRNFWKMDGDKVEYTSLKEEQNDFALSVVITNLYENIMHIRHGAFWEKKLFTKKFPLEMVQNEGQMIRLGLQLLEGKIGVDEYCERLEILADRLESYQFESTVAVLNQYQWKYKVTPARDTAVSRIKQAVEEIAVCIKDKSKWDRIWRFGYSIHNEPEKILEEQ